MGKITLEVGGVTVEREFDDALFIARASELIDGSLPNATPRERLAYVVRWMWARLLEQAAVNAVREAKLAVRRARAAELAGE